MSDSDKKKTKKKATRKESQADDALPVANEDPDELPVENPNALYEDTRFQGEPKSTWEKFQRWSHRHKRKVYVLFFAAIVLTFGAMMSDRQPESAEALARAYFSRFTDANADWRYNIGNYYVDQNYLATLFPVLAVYTYGQAGAQPVVDDGELYEEFLRDQYETDLMVYAAINEGALNEPEARLVIENSVRNAIADYYLYTKIRSADNNFRVEITDAQAMAFYERNKEQYANSELSRAATLQVIKNTLAEVERSRIRQRLLANRAELLDSVREQVGPRFQRQGD